MTQLAFPFPDPRCPFTYGKRRCLRATGHFGDHWDGRWHCLNGDDPKWVGR